jgi:hypothetical protein
MQFKSILNHFAFCLLPFAFCLSPPVTFLLGARSEFTHVLKPTRTLLYNQIKNQVFLKTWFFDLS